MQVKHARHVFWLKYMYLVNKCKINIYTFYSSSRFRAFNIHEASFPFLVTRTGKVPIRNAFNFGKLYAN